MKKILLLNPPGKSRYLRDQYCSSSAKAHYYWPAVDLLVLSGILCKKFELKVIDAIVEGLSREHVLNHIAKENFFAVVSLTSNASKDDDFKLFEEIKNRFEVRLVLNGGFLKHAPEKYLEKFLFLDAIITDFTQNGILRFLNQEEGSFAGLCFRRAGRIINYQSSIEPREFSYPMPQHKLFPLKKYSMPQSRSHPFSCVLMSRGCTFKCRFCSSSKIPFCRRVVANIIDELEGLKKMGIKEIHFSDFNFTSERGHAFLLCEEMIRKELGIGWDCLSRADCLDEEVALIMKQAGCHTIQIGVESKNEALLGLLGKPVKNDTVRRAFALCRKLQIRTIGFFIIGFPGEDEQSIKETIEFAKELDCDYASFSIFVPDFGSDIREDILKGNPELENIYDFDRTKFPVWENGILSKKRIWQLRNKAIRDFYFRPAYISKQLKMLASFRELISKARMCGSLFNKTC
ncbi:MAG: radical SAM protein [Candidatus Omnitrophica bacterium]|nr:radical SAM protein [Candidatus Omnitrophota bacterium]